MGPLPHKILQLSTCENLFIFPFQEIAFFLLQWKDPEYLPISLISCYSPFVYYREKEITERGRYQVLDTTSWLDIVDDFLQ